MYSLHNNPETKKVLVSSLISCIYLPSIVTVISFRGVLYTVGKASSFYILVLIFLAELLKALFLYGSDKTDGLAKWQKSNKSAVGEVLKAILFITCVLFSFFVSIILFGAPALESHEDTLMLSALMTLLTIFPMICHSWVEASMQLLFGVKGYSKNSIFEMLVNNAVLTLCGAWLGAVVIPLDWNRPWQQWPIPCYLGALGGYLLSNALTVLQITLMSASQKYPMLSLLVNVVNKLRVH